MSASRGRRWWARTFGPALLVLCGTLAVPLVAGAAVQLRPLATANAPMFVTHAGDDRLFVVERRGVIRIFRPGTGWAARAFLDIQAKVDASLEGGLLSMAFHRDHRSNGFLYVNYTTAADETVIERYRVSADPNVADPQSAARLLVIPRPSLIHNGGQLQVGPRDGYLYVGMGDGGSGIGDPPCLSQRRDSLMGKMLRLDLNQNVDRPPYHGIPAGNPGGDVVWASGLRNPWRFSFDRVTGDLYIGDVGDCCWEEVSFAPASAGGGLNFGWKVMEGATCFTTAGCPAGTPACNDPALVRPIHVYDHGDGNCSVTGGYVYRGRAIPELAGKYLFGDWCGGNVRFLQKGFGGLWATGRVLDVPGGLTSFGEDAAGELYLTIGDDIFQLVSDAPAPATSVPALGGPARAALALALLLLTIALALVHRSRARGNPRG